MALLNKIKISLRLYGGFAFIIILFTSVCMFGINRISLLSQQTVMMHDHPLTVSNAVLRINTSIIRIHRNMKDIALAKDIAEIDKSKKTIDKIGKKVYRDFEIIKEHFLGAKEIYFNSVKIFEDWEPIREEVISLMRAGRNLEAANITKGKGALHVKKIEKSIEVLGDFAQNKANEFVNKSQKLKSITLYVMYSLLFVSIVIVIVFAYFLSKSINLPIEIMVDGMNKIGHGNFDYKIDVKTGDEFSVLANSFNKMTGNLNSITASRNELKKEMLERMKAEAELETVRSYTNNIIKSSLDMIITVNGDRKIVEFNEAAVKTFGYKREEILGKTIEMLYASQEEATKPVGDLKQKGAFHGEVLNRKKNGDIFPAFVSASFIKDDEGNILGAMGISRDISEQKEVEEALSKSEIKYRELVENAQSIIIRWNKNGDITFFNEYAQKFFGFTEEEILGRQAVGTIVPEKDSSGKDLSRMMEDIVSRPDDFEYNENENIRKNGEKVWVAWKNKMIKNSETGVDEMLSIGIDRTKNKKAEEALKESEIKFRSVTQSATDAIISSDSNGKIISWNNGASHIFGYDEEEVLNKPVSMLMPERYRKSHEEGLIMAVSKEKNKIIGETLELEGLRKNGEEFSLELSLSKWNTQKGVFFTGIIRDITNRKALETQLSHAQKLESIGSLAAGIAHEINTPTQFISDNISFLKESCIDVHRLLKKYADLLDANKNGDVADNLIREVESVIEETDIDFLSKEIPKAIEASERGANRVSTIVKAMKEFSHPGTKEKTPTDINSAIKNTITVSKNEWKYVAEVVTDFDKKLPLVPCLPGDFNQVILNLITNSAHAIGKVVEGKEGSKGTITINTRKEGDFAVVTISDTGSGIPDSIKNKIFYPFFTTKEVGKGTGQGLAISHSVIVDKHNGTLLFESEEGKGTSFIIKLPLKEKNK